MSSASELAEARQETRESWSAALRMIREELQKNGPVGGRSSIVMTQVSSG